MFLAALLSGVPVVARARLPSGLTLLQRPGARASALGEAFSGGTDDIAAWHYNAAALATLTGPQAALLYEKGLADDSFGQALVGAPLPYGALGIRLGVYDGGSAVVSRDGFTATEVTVQSDVVAAVGFAAPLGEGGGWDAGGSLKYISSELAGAYSARTAALDAGIAYSAARWRIGASLQNWGGALRYAQRDNPLPRTVRVGGAWSVLSNRRFTVYAELPYFVEESETEPSVGVETIHGPLAFRVGYQAGTLNRTSFGAGVVVASVSIDYATSLIGELEASHLVSLSFRLPAPSSN